MITTPLTFMRVSNLIPILEKKRIPETFGFRSVSIQGKQIQINGRPFYCHGFGMHEDFEVKMVYPKC